jgi:transposase
MVDIDESFCYLNECGSNYGWSLTGRQALEFRQHRKSKKYTIIAAVTTLGVIAFWVLVNENTTGSVFREFLEQFLFPELGRYPHYLMCDNLRSHTTPEVVAAVRRSPHTMLMRPPYCPQAAPIELVFKAMKDVLRDRFRTLTPANAVNEITLALESISASKCAAFFHRCGYEL